MHARKKRRSQRKAEKRSNVYLNKSLRILIIVNTSMIFIMGLFVPFYAIFVQKLGGDIAFAGFSWAVFSIVSGMLILAFAKWEVKVKEQELLMGLGYLLRGIVFLSYASMTTLSQLMITQVLWGIAAAIGMPAFDALYQAHTTKKESIIQWGSWEGIASIAVGAAALVGGILIQLFGYQSVFVGMAVMSFALALYVWRLPREVL